MPNGRNIGRLYNDPEPFKVVEAPLGYAVIDARLGEAVAVRSPERTFWGTGAKKRAQEFADELNQKEEVTDG